MYTLNVKNNYVWSITSNTGKTIPEKGGSQSFNDQGSMYLEVPGLGSLNFLDLGDRKLDGYPNVTETWGVLMRSHTTEAYYRYEGGGVLNATFDVNGTVTISTTNGILIPVSLDEVVIDSSGIPTN